jgi:type III secretion protein V
MNLERLNRLLLIATSRSDLLLVLLLVSVIFMMILPLPTLVVDFLIAANMSLAAILLMVAIYIQSPLSFSAFPSVLLITTLFRLALSITTTRLILLQADAGAIIDTFGNFVVAGNLIVGLVIFLIITIVQFVVITKGSERVAEVSARFSLDAMPGKQMSIDSDMRAGLIEMDEAKRRRTMLEKESQLYGAMDGAMKFVKGDAIAGLIITAVNIIGGVSIGTLQLGIGTLQLGMSAGEALQRYSILTIGDGLVSQIPALFISITAGMIVTRVTTDESQNLGADIGTQLMAQPKALMVGAGIMARLCPHPGLPDPDLRDPRNRIRRHGLRDPPDGAARGSWSDRQPLDRPGRHRRPGGAAGLGPGLAAGTHRSPDERQRGGRVRPHRAADDGRREQRPDHDPAADAQ